MGTIISKTCLVRQVVSFIIYTSYVAPCCQKKLLKHRKLQAPQGSQCNWAYPSARLFTARIQHALLKQQTPTTKDEGKEPSHVLASFIERREEDGRFSATKIECNLLSCRLTVQELVVDTNPTVRNNILLSYSSRVGTFLCFSIVRHYKSQDGQRNCERRDPCRNFKMSPPRP